MSAKRLSNHKSAQCYVIEYDNGDYDFISYSTTVIKVRFKDGKRFIECTGLYSMTTRRQIGWFCYEYLPGVTYYDIKEIAHAGMVEK